MGNQPSTAANADVEIQRHIQLANHYFTQRNYQQSIDEYQELIRLNHAKTEEYQGEIAVAYCNLGESAKALEHLNTVMQTYPNFAPLYRIKGDIELNLGHFDEALNNAQKCIQLATNSQIREIVLSYIIIALVRYSLNELDLVEDAITTAESVKADEYILNQLWVVQGLILENIENNHKAAEYFEHKMDDFSLSISNILLGNYDVAIAAYSRDHYMYGIDYLVRGKAYFLKKEYAKALDDYCKATVNGYNCPLLISSMIELIGAINGEKKFDVLFNFTTSNGNLLQFSIEQGNNWLPIITALVRPLIIKKLNTPLTISNEGLFQAMGYVSPQGQAMKDVNLMPPQSIAQAYLETRLTEARMQQAQNLFDNEKFATVMKGYKDRIDRGSAEEKSNLCQEASQVALAKFKHDYMVESSQIEGKNAIFQGNIGQKTTFIVSVLQGFFNLGVAKKLQEYVPYFNQCIAALNFIGELSTTSSADVVPLINKYRAENSHAICFLISMGFDLYQAIKEEKYAQVFCLIAAFFQFWALHFGGEKATEFSTRLLDLANDLCRGDDNEQAFFKKMFLFYENSPATQHAARIMGCKKIVFESMKISEAHMKNDKKAGAQHEFASLIANITLACNFYTDKAKVLGITRSIVENMDMTTVVSKQEYNAYESITETLILLEKQLPNALLKETITQLHHFVDSLKNVQSTSKMLVFVKFFSRLLIDYGILYENEPCTYVGVICLGATQAFSAFHLAQLEPSMMGKVRAITLELTRFAMEISNTTKSTAIVRVTAFSVILNLIVEMVYQLQKQEQLNLETVLTALSGATNQASLKIAYLMQQQTNTEDAVLHQIETALTVVNACVVSGQTIKIIYDLFNGKALQTFKTTLQRYLPPESTNLIESGLQLVLCGMGPLGVLSSTLNVSNEVRNVGKMLEARMERMEHHLSTQLLIVGQQLSCQMAEDFILLSHQQNEIHIQLEAVKLYLQKLENLILQNRQIIVNLQLIAPIGSFIKTVNQRLDTACKRGILMDGSEVTEWYQSFITYLTSGDSDTQALASVYSQHTIDWLGILHGLAVQEGFLNDGKKIPNFSLWLETISAFIGFLSRINMATLMQSDSFDLKVIYKLFENAIDIFSLLTLLNSPDFLNVILKKLSNLNVNNKDLPIVVSYCALSGIPLLGYGEDPKYWLSSQVHHQAFREVVVQQLLEAAPTRQTKNTIQDSIRVSKEVVRILGVATGELASYSLGIEQLSALHAESTEIKDNVIQTLHCLFIPQEDIKKLKERVKSCQITHIPTAPGNIGIVEETEVQNVGTMKTKPRTCLSKKWRNKSHPTIGGFFFQNKIKNNRGQQENHTFVPHDST